MDFYKEMSLMRRIEIAADVAYKKKQIRGFLHLYNGQEAVAAGLESELKPSDHVITAYRCHAHMISRRCGTEPKAVLAELLGKDTGCSRGKGGSMHMYNDKTNFHGGNGIVGAQVPIGTGIAWSQKLNKTGAVTVIYYGDGAANQGQIFEASNMAKIHNLPAIYVCENNQYGMGTSVARASATPDFYTRGQFIPGIRYNGMNVLQSREVAKYAVEYARTTGPILLEAKTYRYKGHSMSDPGTTYRSREEVEGIRLNRDPILQVEAWLLSNNLATEEELKAINAEVKAVIDQAVAFAEKSALPAAEELLNHVNASENHIIKGTEGLNNGRGQYAF